MLQRVVRQPLRASCATVYLYTDLAARASELFGLAVPHRLCARVRLIDTFNIFVIPNYLYSTRREKIAEARTCARFARAKAPLYPCTSARDYSDG